MVYIRLLCFIVYFLLTVPPKYIYFGAFGPSLLLLNSITIKEPAGLVILISTSAHDTLKEPIFPGLGLTLQMIENEVKIVRVRHFSNFHVTGNKNIFLYGLYVLSDDSNSKHVGIFSSIEVGLHKNCVL